LSHSTADLRKEVERQYWCIRQQQIEYELQLFRDIDEVFLEKLASILGSDELVRWLCSSHQALWLRRPIDRIASLGSSSMEELLQIARDEAQGDA
jgi:hypothetical protein